MGWFKAAKWVWYGWGGKPRRRATSSAQTNQTFVDGSKLTTKTTSYNRGGDTVRITRSYRLPDGTRRTESTTTTKLSPGMALLVGFLVVGGLLVWPWAFHWPLSVEILLSIVWYSILALVAVAVVPSLNRTLRILLVALLAAAAVAASVLLLVNRGSGGTPSYQDGYQWGQVNTVGIFDKTEPSCLQEEMASNNPVGDPNFIITKPVGDDKPNDNFAQWQVGCEAGAAQVVKEFNSTGS
jgi:hypothetical protein